MVAIEREIPSAAPPTIGADAIPLGARRIGVSPRQVLAAVLIGSAVLGLFTSADLPSWGERLGDSPAALTARSLLAGWNDDLARLDLTAPHAALRRGVGWLLDRRWGR